MTGSPLFNDLLHISAHYNITKWQSSCLHLFSFFAIINLLEGHSNLHILSSHMCIETLWNSLVHFSSLFSPTNNFTELLHTWSQRRKVGRAIFSNYRQNRPQNSFLIYSREFGEISLSADCLECFLSPFCRIELLHKCRRNFGPSTLWNSRTGTLMPIFICNRLSK